MGKENKVKPGHLRRGHDPEVFLFHILRKEGKFVTLVQHT